MKKSILLLLGLCISMFLHASIIPTDTYLDFPLNGNAVDVSKNNFTGTIMGTGITATTDRFGKASGALQFDGSNGSYIDIQNATSVGTADFTISYWASPDASNDGFVFGKNGLSGVSESQFRIGGNGSYFGCFTDKTDASIGGGISYVPTANTWSQYVVTREGKTMTLYVDGQIKSTLVTSSIIEHDNAINYMIGAFNGTTFYKGKLDELKMYNHALTVNEIAAIYNPNNALAFNGVDNYIDLGTLTSTDNFSNGFTFMCWAKFNSFDQWARIFDFGNGNPSDNLLLGVHPDGSMSFHNYNGSNVISLDGPAVLTTNTWTHIAITVNSSGLETMYVNGVAIASVSGNIPTNVARTMCYIGKSLWVQDPYLNAQIDEASIWSQALSINDIQNSIISAVQGNESNLYAFYNFNQSIAAGDNTSKTTLVDNSTTGLNASLVNFLLTASTSNFVAGYDPIILALSKNSVSLQSANGSNDIVSIGSLTSWTASSDQPWLTVSPTNGTGFGSVTLTATETIIDRTATVTISVSGIQSKTITVTQTGVNVLSNPSAENGFDSWTITNGGDGWGFAGNESSRSGNNCWSSSYDWGSLSQTINLLDRGYSEVSLDASPTINAGVYAKAYEGCGDGTISIVAELLDASGSVLATNNISNSEYIGTSNWQLKSGSFSGYGAGVRQIRFTLSGIDDYCGNGGSYGPAFDDASVTIDAKPFISLTAITNPTTSIDSTSATLNGQVFANGSSTTVTFEYGTSLALGSSISADQSPVVNASPVSVSKGITGLSANTIYYVRTKAVNATETNYSAIKTFTTNPYELSVSSTTATVQQPSASSSTIDITAVSNLQWTAISDQQWLTVSPSTLKGNGTITLTTNSANTNTIDRIATVTILADGAISQIITVTQLSPSITVSTPSIAFGHTDAGSTSSETSFTISATELLTADGNITVTAPSNFEISLSSGSGFTKYPIVLAYTASSLASKTIYIRFKPTALNTIYSGNCIISGGGAADQSISVSGSSTIVYCSVNTAYVGAMGINSVDFNTISTNKGTQNNSYNDFTSTITNVTRESSYNLTLTGWNYYQYFMAFIDWNNDGDFDDSEESKYIGDGINVSNFIQIPANATLGNIRMRVRSEYDGNGAPSACGEIQYGETMDFTLNIQAITNEWNGSVSSDWTDVSNWSLGSLPLSNYDVIIKNGTPKPDITAVATCNNVTIEPQAGLTISGGTLNVNGNLTLQSNALGTATLVDNGTVIVTGITTVQQYFTGSGGATPDGRYWYISSPVTGATSATVDAKNANILKQYIETSHAWSELTDNTTILPVGTGYYTRLDAATTTAFTGTLNTGTVTLTPTRSGTSDAKRGFNLVGNPYPSYLNWDDVEKTNIQTTMWYRSNNGLSMVFDTYNSVGAVGTDNNGTEVNKFIPPMQAFWVRVSNDGDIATLSFKNTMRSHQTGNVLKSNTQKDIIRLKVSNGTNSDEAIIVFNADATNGIDAFDSEKMFAGDVSISELYTVANSQKLVINGLESAVSNPIIPLGFKTAKAGTYTITAKSIEGLDGVPVVLEDKLLNKIQDLTQLSSYSFSSDSVDNASRFVLRLKSTTAANEVEAYVNIFAKTKAIAVTTTESTGKITVTDVLGRTITTQTIVSTQTEIEVPSGVYFVTVQTNNGVITKQVVVE